MHSKSLALAAALALASTTLAEQDRPRIYFPRHIKRQFFNSTITRPDSFPPEKTDEPSKTTKRITLDDIIGEVGDPIFPGFASDKPTNSDSEVVIVTVPTTVLAVPTGSPDSSVDIGSSGGIPPILVLPTVKLPPLLGGDEGDGSSSSGILLAPTGPVTSDPASESSTPSSIGNSTEETTTEELPTITKPPILPLPIPTDPLGPIESIVSSIIEDLPDLPLNTTLPDLPGLNTTIPDPPLPTPSDDLTVLPPLPDPTTTTPPEPTVTEPPPPPSSTLPPDGDKTTTEPPPETTTDVPPPPPPTSTNGTISDPPTPTTTQPPEPPTSDQTTYTSAPILSTVTGTDAWLGTKLAADESSPTKNADVPAPTSSEAVSGNLPNTIDGVESEMEQPEGTTLIRIAYDHQLHYEFVADNYTAAKQIFLKTPTFISFAEAVTADDIKVLRLGYLDTKSTLGFLTTQVFMYVPTPIVESLQMDILLPSSLIYHSKDPVAYALAHAINPSISIIPGGVDGLGGTPGAPEAGGDPFQNPGPDKEQTASEKGTTVGITFGAIGVAAAYGAAMFLIARRYKQKKQAHRRASSITNSSDMRYSENGAPAMMGGALLSRDFSSYGGVTNGNSGSLPGQSPGHSPGSNGFGAAAGGRNSHGSGRSGMGNSGRTAYISAPVAAENSLGWN